MAADGLVYPWCRDCDYEADAGLPLISELLASERPEVFGEVDLAAFARRVAQHLAALLLLFVVALPVHAAPADRYDLDILLGGRSSPVDGIAGVQHSISVEFSRELGPIDLGIRAGVADVEKIRINAPNNMGRALHGEVFFRAYLGAGWGAEVAASRVEVQTDQYEKSASRVSLSAFYLLRHAKIEASYVLPDDTSNRSSFVSLSYSFAFYRGLYARLSLAHARHASDAGLTYSLALGIRVF